MKGYLRRRPLAVVLLLLIHLLTWGAGDADTETKFPDVKRSARADEIILEEVIISGSGNNTRIIANAVAEEPSQLGREILSLLSERQIRQRSSDQDVGESRDATIVHVEDDEDDLERLRRVVAKYEPQRISSRIAKRKILDAPIDTHDTPVIIGGKNAGSTARGSTADLESTYHEVLRNISRGISQLTMNNPGVTLSPYLSQVMRNLKRIPIPETTRTADGAERPSHSNRIDPSHTLSALKKKKLLLKKYMQPNRTITTTPGISLEDGESSLGESAANESTTSKGHLLVNGNPKLKSGPSTESSSSVPSDPTEKSGNRRESNDEGPSTHIPPSLTVLQSNNHIFHATNSSKKQPSSLQNVLSSLHLPLMYRKVPRPFSASATNSPQLFNAADTVKNIATSYSKPSSSTNVAHQVDHPVLPLVLPTDLFNAPTTRRYFPTKRANREFKSDGIHTAATTVFSNVNPPGDEETAVIPKRPTPYAIGAAKIPADSRPGYYVITESPTKLRTVAATSFATTYTPGQLSAPHILPRRRESQHVAAPKTELVPGIAYDASNVKLDLNANPGIALYNKFAGLYSIPTGDVVNVLHAPQAVARDYENFKQPSLPAQQALPYATLRPLKPISSALLRSRPIVAAKPLAPYFDSSLLLSQQPGGGKLDDGKGGEGDVGASEPSRVGNTEGDVKNDKSGDYDTLINHGTYKVHEDVKPTPAAVHKNREMPSKQQRKQDRDENGERHQDGYRRHEDEKDDKDGRSENTRDGNDEDGKEDGDETRDGEYANIRENKNEDEDDDNRYDKFGFDRDDSREEQREKQRSYDAERYDEEDKYDRDVGVNRKLTDGYGDRGDDNKYRSNLHEQQDSARDSRYDEKSQRGRDKEELEDESVAEDDSIARRAEDQRGKYRKEWYSNDDDDDDKRKYYSRPTGPKDSLRQAPHKYEEYSETNPQHVSEKYQHRQRVKENYRDLKQDNGNDGHGNEKQHDPVHGETQEHKHEEKHGGDHKFAVGGGAEQEEEHHGHEGEKGDKGYKVWHEHEKAEKGHHDKEHSSKEYDEKDGQEKKHNEEGGYHKEHHHDEKGEKEAEFGEKGEHQKGHSTKGEHKVHKKDEYEKKTEFFDEFHEDGHTEKHGGHHQAHESKKGGHEKKAHHDAADHEESHGKEHKYEKGGHHHEHKGHKVAEGHDHHYDHDHKHGDKGGHEHGKKWNYKKGDDGDHKR